MQNGGNYTETKDHEIQYIRNLQSTNLKSDNAQATNSNDLETQSEKESSCYAPYLTHHQQTEDPIKMHEKTPADKSLSSHALHKSHRHAGHI